MNLNIKTLGDSYYFDSPMMKININAMVFRKTTKAWD